MRAACERLLAQARAVRAGYPNETAMRAVEVTPLPAGTDQPDLRSAMQYLWQEIELLRDGKAGSVGVLDDEIAHVEAVLARPV
jgi:hypothetical protein